jgi:hypothetical protein
MAASLRNLLILDNYWLVWSLSVHLEGLHNWVIS